MLHALVDQQKLKMARPQDQKSLLQAQSEIASSRHDGRATQANAVTADGFGKKDQKYYWISDVCAAWLHAVVVWWNGFNDEESLHCTATLL